MYLRVTGMKSAFAQSAPVYTGAALAGRRLNWVQSWRNSDIIWGWPPQIANDIKGITGLRDIRQRKITLPVTYPWRKQTEKYIVCWKQLFLKRYLK